jgi:hypothetical protein
MDQSRFIAKHVVNLPKSGIRDFNYGKFAAIKRPAAVFNTLEFDGIRI